MMIIMDLEEPWQVWQRPGVSCRVLRGGGAALKVLGRLGLGLGCLGQSWGVFTAHEGSWERL